MDRNRVEDSRFRLHGPAQAISRTRRFSNCSEKQEASSALVTTATAELRRPTKEL